MKAHQSIDFCPAYNYLKYGETDDVRYLIKGVDASELPKISETDKAGLQFAANNLTAECANLELQEYAKNQVVFNSRRHITIKQIEYNQVLAACNFVLTFGYDTTMSEILKAYGHTLTAENCTEQLKAIINNNENRRLQIAEQETELKSVSGEDGRMDLHKLALIIEKHLKRDIDLHKISMKKFIMLKIDTIKSIENGARAKNNTRP